MFEDLVKQKEISIEKKIERCPYCGSYIIHKYEKLHTMDDRWTQKTTCRLCNKDWVILYNEDQSPSRILLKKEK